MKQRRLLRPARLATWLVVVVAGAYLFLRFELASLPEGSCSPVLAVSAGQSMWIDLWPSSVGEGDVVLFRDPQGDKLLLGKVAAPPTSLPAEAAARLEGGALWIVGDVPRCPARDSRLLGPIERGAVAGRLLFAW